MMVVHFCFDSAQSSAIHEAQSDAPQRRTRGAERCTAPSSTSEVQTPELPACQSAPAHAARLAWARRLRRLTLVPLPWPSPRGLRKRARCAWRRARRENGVPRPPSRHRGTRCCCLRASDAIQLSTPGSSRTSPWLREMPTRPKTGAAMLCSWPSLRRSHRGRSGQAWCSPAPGCSS